MAESPLQWLASRKDKDGRALISEAEFNAGEKLRTDFWLAQMSPSVTANWSLLLAGGDRRVASCGSSEGLDHVIAAEGRVRRALAAVGPELSGILVDVCCFLKGLEIAESDGGWPKRSGKVVLQIALKQLARHYGMLRGDVRDGATAIRHWGADDFRPRADPSPAD